MPLPRQLPSLPTCQLSGWRCSLRPSHRHLRPCRFVLIFHVRLPYAYIRKEIHIKNNYIENSPVFYRQYKILQPLFTNAKPSIFLPRSQLATVRLADLWSAQLFNFGTLRIPHPRASPVLRVSSRFSPQIPTIFRVVDVDSMHMLCNFFRHSHVFKMLLQIIIFVSFSWFRCLARFLSLA